MNVLFKKLLNLQFSSFMRVKFHSKTNIFFVFLQIIVGSCPYFRNMSVKVGDTVRYLNAVGGGVVKKIVDGLAYVDDDGFETPVLLRECVVVLSAGSAPAEAKKSAREQEHTHYSAPSPAVTHVPEPVVEVPGGDIINVMLAFEPKNISTLSSTDFDAFIVNDSNYWLFMTVSTNDDGGDGVMKTLFSGPVEPNMQILAFGLKNNEIGTLKRLSIQAIAFKRDKTFRPVNPIDISLKIDAVKFAKLHCFRPNSYFENRVLAWDIVRGGHPADCFEPDLKAVSQAMMAKNTGPAHKAAAPGKKPNRPDVLVVDLHASELFDTTAGLSAADILNAQVDKFRSVMDENLRHTGQKIVFIHGKGEGVLRQALYKELTHRYKGHDVQDASFREYGFGATQVTITSAGQAKRR